jgi:metal-responsive CopG/Arc/MetJ family transcriptional regulator
MSPVGRPEIGQPINVRLGDELLAAVDAKAQRLGMSRAEVIRTVLARQLLVTQYTTQPTQKRQI